jgi:hypothetical protein
VVEPETSRALDECLDLTAAHLERLDRVAIKQACSFYDVRFFHDSFFSGRGRGNGSPISMGYFTVLQRRKNAWAAPTSRNTRVRWA